MIKSWRIYRSYRLEREKWPQLWYGRVYLNPDWVSMHLDGVGSKLLWTGWALSEKSIRRKIAREILKHRHEEDDSRWRRTRGGRIR